MLRIKVKPDRFYRKWSYVYYKMRWWSRWKSAGWTPNEEIDEKIKVLRRLERLLS